MDATLTCGDKLTQRRTTSEIIARLSVCRTIGNGPNAYHKGCVARSSAVNKIDPGVAGATILARAECATDSEARGEVSAVGALVTIASSRGTSAVRSRIDTATAVAM